MTFRLRSLMLAVIVVGLEVSLWTSIKGDLFGDLSLDSWQAKTFFLFYFHAFGIVFIYLPARLVSQCVRALSEGLRSSATPDSARRDGSCDQPGDTDPSSTPEAITGVAEDRNPCHPAEDHGNRMTLEVLKSSNASHPGT